MLRMDLDLKIAALYAYYNLPAPEDAAMDGYADMLLAYSDDALDYAIRAFREDRTKMPRGENIGLALKKLASAYRPASAANTNGPCPNGCRNGLFYYKSVHSAAPYVVAPCSHCRPDTPGALPRATVERMGHILTPEEVMRGEAVAVPRPAQTSGSAAARYDAAVSRLSAKLKSRKSGTGE